MLATWKAGYVEDAEYLHLALKVNFAPAIKAWLQDPAVREAYAKHTPGGEGRLNALSTSVDHALSRAVQKWARS